LSKTAPRTSVSRLLRTPGSMGRFRSRASWTRRPYFAGRLDDVDQQHVPAGNVLLGHEADPAISRSHLRALGGRRGYPQASPSGRLDRSRRNEGTAPKADGPSAAAGRRRHGGACAACDADGPRAGQAARGYSPGRQIALGPAPLTTPGAWPSARTATCDQQRRGAGRRDLTDRDKLRSCAAGSRFQIAGTAVTAPSESRPDSIPARSMICGQGRA